MPWSLGPPRENHRPKSLLLKVWAWDQQPSAPAASWFEMQTRGPRPRSEQNLRFNQMI